MIDLIIIMLRYLHVIEIKKICLPSEVMWTSFTIIPTILLLSKGNIHPIRCKNSVFQMEHYTGNAWIGGRRKSITTLFDVLVFISIICIRRNLMIQTPCVVCVSNRLPCTIWRATEASTVDDNSFEYCWSMFIIKGQFSSNTSSTSINSEWN